MNSDWPKWLSSFPSVVLNWHYIDKSDPEKWKLIFFSENRHQSSISLNLHLTYLNIIHYNSKMTLLTDCATEDK